MWLSKLLFDTSMTDDSGAYEIRVDNQGFMALAQNHTLNERIMNIEIKFNLVSHKVRDGTMRLTYVPSAMLAAEFLTQKIPREKHRTNRVMFGMAEDE